MKKSILFPLLSALALSLAPLATAQTASDWPALMQSMQVLKLGSGSFLGVGVQEVNAERAKALKLKEEYGVEITMVETDSPAAKAGLKTEDVVLEYNGQRVEGAEQFVRLVRETPAGRNVKLLVSRAGATQTLTAAIGARKGGLLSQSEPFRIQMPNMPNVFPDVPKTYMAWKSGTLGVDAESLEPQLAAYFGVKEGVLVRAVSKNSAAEKAGLKAGDVIVKVDDTAVSSPNEVSRAVRAAMAKKTFPVVVMREKKELSVSVTLDDEPKGVLPRSRPVVVRQ